MSTPLIFQDAEKARDNICAEDQKKIRQLYQEWAKEVGERAEYYGTKTNASAYWQQQQMLVLQKQLENEAKEIYKQIQSGAKESMYLVADKVVGANAAYLSALGFPKDGVNAALTSVPTQVVNNIVTGQIYESGWSLSKAIWGDQNQTLSDIYTIVAKGRAMNMSTYDVSKMLEKYINPSKAKMWNLKMADGVKIYKKSVDYNAQRLVRTLNQHAYQQSIIQSAKANPFIKDVIWRANGSRACPICLDRDGQHFAWDNVPMDHPNGMCTMEPNTDMDSTVDQLVDWFNSPDGTFPEIDEFAKNFGYVPGVSQLSQTQQDWLSKAGYTNGQMPKDFTEFAHRLTFEQQGELLKAAGGDWSDDHPYQKMEKWFNANIMQPGAGTSVKASVGNTVGIESLGKSKGKTFNYWYTKLDTDQKVLAKKLKEDSGLTWQQFYEKHIYSGPKGAVGAATSAGASGSLPAGATAYNLDRSISNMSMDEIMKIFNQQDESGMLSMEARAFAKMTNAQSDGLNTYTGSSYTEMNGYLRYLAAGKSESEARQLSYISKRQMEALNNAREGLANAAMEKGIMVRRGTDLGDLAGFMPGDFRDNVRALENMSIEELNKRFAGTTGTYAGFTSTSSLYGRGFSGDVEIVAYLPKGAQASSVMSISQFGTGEGETLMNAGTNVRIDRIEASDGHMGSSMRVFMDIIGVSR